MTKNNEPATKKFVQKAINELAEAVKVGFDETSTKDDFAILGKRVNGLDKKVDGLDKKVDGLDKKVDGLDKKFGRLERGQRAMLGILDENNQLLKEIRRLPERVARLERSVFRH